MARGLLSPARRAWGQQGYFGRSGSDSDLADEVMWSLVMSMLVALVLPSLSDGVAAFTVPQPRAVGFPFSRATGPARSAVLTSRAVGDEGQAVRGSAWYAEQGDAPAVAMESIGSNSSATSPDDPDEKPGQLLEEADILNTRWKVLVMPREEGWLPLREFEAEFTLLADGSVVWGGDVGGFGVGGRWTLRDETLEVSQLKKGRA